MGLKLRAGDRVFAVLPFVPITAIGLLAASAWVQKGLGSWVTLAESLSLGSLLIMCIFLIKRGKHLHEDEWVWTAVLLSLAGAGWLGWYAWTHYLAALPSTAKLSAGDQARLSAHLQAMTALMALAGNVTLGLGALLGIWLSNKKDRRVAVEAGKLSLTLLKGDMDTAIKTLEGDKSFKPDADDARLFKDLSRDIKRRIDRGSAVPDGIGSKLGTLIDYFATIDGDSWDERRPTQATESLVALKALIKCWGLPS